MEEVEVFCDAGISPASMLNPTSSQKGPDLVGRSVVLIPSLNYGYIEQLREGILNRKGNPASNLVEILAIKKAKEICIANGLTSFVILTDSLSSTNTIGFQEGRWLEQGRLHLASLLLQRIINRARYLRHSSRKVVNRKPLDDLQADEFRLFNAEKLEFELSRSPLWNKIQAEISATNRP